MHIWVIRQFSEQLLPTPFERHSPCDNMVSMGGFSLQPLITSLKVRVTALYQYRDASALCA